MKKMRILVSLICLAALLCGLLAGCNNGTQSGGPVNGDIDAKIAAEPKKVSILVPGFDGSDPDSVYSRAIARFEATYGKEVEILQAVGEQLWNEKVAAQIAANDPVDVFYISVDQYLGMYLKNYLLPVDEYVDLNHPLNNKEVMDNFVKFDGKYYAAGVTATPYVLFYNRDILMCCSTIEIFWKTTASTPMSLPSSMNRENGPGKLSWKLPRNVPTPITMWWVCRICLTRSCRPATAALL